MKICSLELLALEAGIAQCAFYRLDGSLLASSIYTSRKKAIEQLIRSGRSLAHAYLPHVDLSSTSLSGADFFKAELSFANFSHCDLSGVDFSGAVLHGADFYKAKLDGVNFFKADVSRANFLKSNAHETNIGSAFLKGACL